MQVSYFSSPYVSFHRAAGGYRWCLRHMGHSVGDADARGDIVILHGEPQDFPGVLETYRPLPGRPVVGYVAWEHALLGGAQRRGLDLLDEVWVPSHFCRDRLCGYHGNIHVVPHVVVPPVADEAASAWLRAQIDDRPGAFRFYAITRPGDPRKNLEATLEAFAGLTAERPLQLIVKAAPGLDVPESLPPGVLMLRGAWPNARINALHHLGHVFVNSHRAEGWGLGITEAMALGRIAVATGYGGNMDYMNTDNSFPLPWRPVPVPPGVLASDADAARAARQTWAEVDGDALTGAMQTAVDRWPELAPMRTRAVAAMAPFAPGPVAALLHGRLAALVPPDA
jgi:glycosyltransferase involved in cell wall biosynthesis